MRQGQQRKGGPGRGVRRGTFVQHVCRFDDETFDQIHAMAVAEGISLSEAIRQLVEFGLEADSTQPPEPPHA
jgi:hypothetical protein